MGCEMEPGVSLSLLGLALGSAPISLTEAVFQLCDPQSGLAGITLISPLNICDRRSGLKGSLQRLQLEYVDVVFANRPDNNTPMEGESHSPAGEGPAAQVCLMNTDSVLSLRVRAKTGRSGLNAPRTLGKVYFWLVSAGTQGGGWREGHVMHCNQSAGSPTDLVM
ncbi:hypothetical protein JZ751_013453 [Albula glossodonta]|uniref:Uncharacterized protein n=1 Tax=Albula glossodonta TaxID=121402 RepID=A0A8T2MYD4_9TELE|nr:hypothetical protein JZ751_013453 [Albula glossodonta]